MDVELFSLFLQQRIQEAEMRGNRESHVTSALYAVDFASKLRGFPTVGGESVIRMIVEAAKRKLGRPVQKKRPLTKELARSITESWIPDLQSLDLVRLRTVLFLQLSFALAARWDDVCVICPDHIMDHGADMVIFMEHRKNDQQREGLFTPLVDSKDPKGVCELLRRWLALLPVTGDMGSLPIWRRVQAGKVRGQSLRTQVVSYSTMSQSVKEALLEVGEDPRDFGCHSGRAGGASAAAVVQRQSGGLISSELVDRHGGWALGSTSRRGYVEEERSQLLAIPSALQL
jgi:hypothetical protein